MSSNSSRRAISILFLALYVNAILIDTPSGVSQCSTTTLSWKGGSPPYVLSVGTSFTASSNGLPESLLFSNMKDTSLNTTLYWPSGTQLIATVIDEVGTQSKTDPFTIQSGSSDACLNKFKTTPSNKPLGKDFDYTAPLGPYSICNTTTPIIWDGGTPPYILTITGVNLKVFMAQQYQNISVTNVSPTLHFPSGTKVSIWVQDDAAQLIQSPPQSPITLGGGDTSCVLSGLEIGSQIPVSIPGSNPTALPTGTQSSSNPASSSNPPNSNNGGGNNNNNNNNGSGIKPIIPIAVGAGGGGTVVIVLIIFFVRWNKRKQTKGTKLPNSGNGNGTEEIRTPGKMDHYEITPLQYPHNTYNQGGVTPSGPGQMVLQPSTFNPSSDTKEVHLYPPTSDSQTNLLRHNTGGASSSQTHLLSPGASSSSPSTSAATSPIILTPTTMATRRPVYHVDGGPVGRGVEEEEEHFPPAYQDHGNR